MADERSAAPDFEATKQGVIERDREICENLKTFYSPECLVLLSVIATLQNLAAMITQARPALVTVFSHISADAIRAVASMSKRPEKQVMNDVLTIARNRLVMVKS